MKIPKRIYVDPDHQRDPHSGLWFDKPGMTHDAIYTLLSEPADGASLIASERARQISEEGWTTGHDDEHDHGELAINAALLAADGTDAVVRNPDGDDPWCLLTKHGTGGLKPDRVRALTIAGALIAAEIDRLQRDAAVPMLAHREGEA